jgi:hypothetical protein
MKNTTKYLIIILLAGMALITHSQTPLREVAYTTTTSKVFAVPKNINIQEEVTTYDLTKMTSIDKNARHVLQIGIDGKLTIQDWYLEPPRFLYDYEFGVGSSYTDETGTYIFDHEGNPLDTSLFDVPNPDFQIETGLISSFGLVELFKKSLLQWQQQLESLKYTVAYTSGGSGLIAVNDSMEIFLNPTELTYEIRVYKDSLLEYSDWNKYQDVKGKIIPLVSVLTTYELLENQTRFQISEVTRYNSYYVLNQTGDTVVAYFEQNHPTAKIADIQIARFDEQHKRNAQLRVYPNPGTDIIYVDIPSFIGEVVDLQMMNMQGSVILKSNDLKTNQTHTLDISHLQPGTYLVRIGKEGVYKTAKFIKD